MARALRGSPSAGTRTLGVALLMVMCICASWAAPQDIDTDVNHWLAFVFSGDEGTVSLKIPPKYRIPLAAAALMLPEKAYSRNNQRQLFSFGYDPGRNGDDFQILGMLDRLQDALPAALMNPDSVHFAIRTSKHRPNLNDGTDKLRPQLEEMAGLKWFHYDGREYGDSYYARVDDRTLLWIAVTYYDSVRKDPQLVASRKAIARQVVESVRITN